MRAGAMTYKLRLLKPQQIASEFGTNTQLTYDETAVVWAERVKARGFKRQEAAENFSDYSVEWNIRDAHKVEEGWQVEQLGGYLYTVTNVIPNRARGMLTLVTERVNR